jgi:hypothetical protein
VNRTIPQTNAGNTFTLSLPTFTVKFSQAANLPNGRTRGKGFNMRDLANDFKVHKVKSQIAFELSILGFSVA